MIPDCALLDIPLKFGFGFVGVPSRFVGVPSVIRVVPGGSRDDDVAAFPLSHPASYFRTWGRSPFPTPLCWLARVRQFGWRCCTCAGIAYDSQGDNVYITGKYWPSVYKINLVPSTDAPRPAQLDEARNACIN